MLIACNTFLENLARNCNLLLGTSLGLGNIFLEQLEKSWGATRGFSPKHWQRVKHKAVPTKPKKQRSVGRVFRPKTSRLLVFWDSILVGNPAQHRGRHPQPTHTQNKKNKTNNSRWMFGVVRTSPGRIFHQNKP